MNPLLQIKNLHASVNGNEILKGIHLTIHPGETHAIMGPNGSGKSTLAYVLAGKEGYEVTEGEILFKGKNLLEMEPEERAAEGLFLAMQYPVELPGVSNMQFLKTALNEIRLRRNEKELDAREFLDLIKKTSEIINLPASLLNRSVNEGFSGGEKKKNEIFQMALLQPELSVLDETDSGLDIDALKMVAESVNKLRTKNNAFLVITHYQRLLNYIVPDVVHILSDGKIIRTGTKELALEVEEKGYDIIKS
jgi:Fe-S cluster assembly ATP-binding protein